MEKKKLEKAKIKKREEELVMIKFNQAKQMNEENRVETEQKTEGEFEEKRRRRILKNKKRN